MNALFSVQRPKLPGARSGDAPVACFQSPENPPGQLVTKASPAPFCDEASPRRAGSRRFSSAIDRQARTCQSLATIIHAERALTRLDLLVLIAVVALLISWFGLGLVGERGRTARCAANLKALGNAMQSFGNEHGEAIPPALAAGQQTLLWDAQLAPYLPLSRVKNGIEPAFQCPSDQLPHARARSYTMSAHDMRSENWPLGPNTDTGVGLVWYPACIAGLLGETAVKAAMTNVDFLAMVKPSQLPAPAQTLVLTEMIHSDNNLKGINWSYIDGPGQQLEQLFHGTRIHNGRYHYLMADGHVELMSPLQAGTPGARGNIWSIRKTD